MKKLIILCVSISSVAMGGDLYIPHPWPTYTPKPSVCYRPAVPVLRCYEPCRDGISQQVQVDNNLISKKAETNFLHAGNIGQEVNVHGKKSPNIAQISITKNDIRNIDAELDMYVEHNGWQSNSAGTDAFQSSVLHNDIRNFRSEMEATVVLNVDQVVTRSSGHQYRH